MQIDEIIAKVDGLEPNQYDKETKISWLSQLDGKIFAEVILTHINVPQRLKDHCEVNEDTGEYLYKPYVTGDEETIAGAPYGEDMYCYYLMAMIALHNMESTKYNQAMTAYNNAFNEYSNYYNRTHLPIKPAWGNRLRF